MGAYKGGRFMKCLFIINPVAGTKSLQKQMDRFIGQLILHTDVNQVDVFYTKKKDDALHKASTLQPGAYDFLTVVGGDGTINEALTGLVQSGSDIPVAILPAGTVNDFGSFLRLPVRPKEFAEMIKEHCLQPVDLGSIGDRCFVNVISGGMFSDIGFQVKKEEKNLLGPLAYYLTGLRDFNNQINTNLHLKVTVDGFTFEENACLFLLTNTASVGGFRGITPLANVQDGALDLIIFKNTDLLDKVSIFKDFLLDFHNHLEHPSVHYAQARHIRIECDQPIIYDVDGEQGKDFPIDVECLHHAVRLFVPKNTNL